MNAKVNLNFLARLLIGMTYMLHIPGLGLGLCYTSGEESAHQFIVDMPDSGRNHLMPWPSSVIDPTLPVRPRLFVGSQTSSILWLSFMSF